MLVCAPSLQRDKVLNRPYRGGLHTVNQSFGPAMSSEDEAPECISLAASRDSVLEELKASRVASRNTYKAEKDRRRATDALLKSQALLRQERIASIVAEITKPKMERKEILETKRIHVEVDKENLEREEEVRPGEKVVILRDRVLIKKNLRLAEKLARSKESMMLMQTANNRVDASESQAHRRLGRPASRFVTSKAEEELVKQRLKAMLPPKKRKAKRGSRHL